MSLRNRSPKFNSVGLGERIVLYRTTSVSSDNLDLFKIAIKIRNSKLLFLDFDAKILSKFSAQ